MPGIPGGCGSRVIDWHGDFDGESLQDFKQCLNTLDRAERARAVTHLNNVREASFSVKRAMKKLDKPRGGRHALEPVKTVRSTLRRYQKELSALEGELQGVLKGRYPQRLLMMNSPGGYVQTLHGVLPYLSSGKMDVFGGQMIASAGGVAFVSARGKRIMPESGGEMGIHSCQAGAGGGVKEMVWAVNEIKRVNKFMEKQYVRNSRGKLKPAQFRKWLDESTGPGGMKWLSGRQAMRYGICDSLCRDAEKLLNGYRPKPVNPLLSEVEMYLKANRLTSKSQKKTHGSGSTDKGASNSGSTDTGASNSGSTATVASARF